MANQLCLGRGPAAPGSVCVAVRVSLSLLSNAAPSLLALQAAVVRVVGWAALRRTPTSRPVLEPPWSARERVDACVELWRRFLEMLVSLQYASFANLTCYWLAGRRVELTVVN